MVNDIETTPTAPPIFRLRQIPAFKQMLNGPLVKHAVPEPRLQALAARSVAGPMRTRMPHFNLGGTTRGMNN